MPPCLQPLHPASLEFLAATTRAGAIRTLESLARIELGAQGGALLERVTTTRISRSGVATTRRVSCITRVSVSKLPKGPGPGRLSSVSLLVSMILV